MIKIVKENIIYWQKYRFILWFFSKYIPQDIPQEVLNKIRDKSITQNILRIQDNDSIMCGFLLYLFHRIYASGKILLDYTNLFFPNDYKKNEKII